MAHYESLAEVEILLNIFLVIFYFHRGMTPYGISDESFFIKKIS